MEENRALQIHNRLVQGVLGGSGVEGIATILASLVESTVVLEDPGFNMIVAAVPRGSEIKTGIFPEWATHKDFLNKPDVKELLKSAKDNMRSVWVPAYPDIGIKIPSLIAPIIIRNEVLGYVSIYCRTNQEFTSLDFMACEQAAIVVALEMLRQRTADEVEERIKGDLFDDLFSSRFENSDAVIRRGRHLGYNLLNISRVFVLKPHDLEKHFQKSRHQGDEFFVTKKITKLIHEALLFNGQEMMIGTKSDSIILLVQVPLEKSRTQALNVARKIQTKIAEKLPEVSVSIGVGACCQKVEDYRQSFETARKCIEFLEKQGRQGQILLFEDTGINRLLFSVGDASIALDFIKETLGSLLEYDRHNNTEFCGTLASYFENQYSLQRTAEACFIHISTLRYRLQRVEEILDVNLNSSEQAFNLHIAIKAYETLMQRNLVQKRPGANCKKPPATVHKQRQTLDII